MTTLNVNRLTERIMVAGSACALVAAIAALDDGVRGRFVGLLTGDASTEMAMAGTRLQLVARTITQSVGYQGTEHAWLALFAMAAVVFLVLMLGT